ncbi:hypothetical protein BDV18DRAFT_158055 [Aspergillus unguis]
MKFSLAVALNLALLATAAPAALKRDNGAAPSSDVSSETANKSLKSAAGMIRQYSPHGDNSNREQDDGDDDDDDFDGFDDFDLDDDSIMKNPGSANAEPQPEYSNNLPINMIPNSEANFPGVDGGAFDPAAIPSPSSSAPASASASPSPSPTASGSPVDQMKMAEESPSASASASPSSSAAPAKPTQDSPLGGLGGLSSITDLLGGVL